MDKIKYGQQKGNNPMVGATVACGQQMAALVEKRTSKLCVSLVGTLFFYRSGYFGCIEQVRMSSCITARRESFGSLLIFCNTSRDDRLVIIEQVYFALVGFTLINYNVLLGM